MTIGFPNFSDAVRWAIRHDVRFRLLPGGLLAAWQDDPGPGPSLDGQVVFDAVEPFLDAIRERLRRPRGWPKGVPIPHWWSDVAIAFNILEAKPNDCPECAFPVAVLIGFDGYDAWHCPQCGVHLIPRKRENARPAETPT